MLSVLSVLLFLAGAGMFTYPFFTDLYATQMIQQPLAEQFDTPELAERYATRTIGTGDPLTRLVIPAIGIDVVVVEGTSAAALRAGAGHYPDTPLPGEAGNVAIAGHRTTYGKPFNRLDEIPEGSTISLITPLAEHTYRVVAAPAEASGPCPNGACWVTDPLDWGVIDATPVPSLTLTTCHPKGSARQRLILRAELVESRDRLPDGSTDTRPSAVHAPPTGAPAAAPAPSSIPGEPVPGEPAPAPAATAAG